MSSDETGIFNAYSISISDAQRTPVTRSTNDSRTADSSTENDAPATRTVQVLRAISPLFHADKIKEPLLVLQGANDPRVLRAESDEIVAAARHNGVPAEYVVFPMKDVASRKRRTNSSATKRH